MTPETFFVVDLAAICGRCQVTRLDHDELGGDHAFCWGTPAWPPPPSTHTHDSTTDDDYKEPIPDTIEVPSTEVDQTDDRVPRGARTLIKQALKAGWELRKITYSRGPWMHSLHWTPISTSDLLVVRLVGMVDTERRAVVACWRDGKFDHAYLLSNKTPMHLGTSTAAKAWFAPDPKETPTS